jgi:hypothetical protein
MSVSMNKHSNHPASEEEYTRESALRDIIISNPSINIQHYPARISAISNVQKGRSKENKVPYRPVSRYCK